MLTLLFLKGLFIGFAIAAPVGPIGVLCIQRSLHDGFKVGLMTGMGAVTNPMTILSFIAIFAGLGLGTASIAYADAILLVLGITLGSAVWWLMLSGGVAYILHKRVSLTFMRVINWVSGGIMLTFGLMALSVLI